MTELRDIFNNRELSTIIWIVILVFGIQFKKETRQATRGLIKAFLATSIVVVNLLAVLYSSLIIYLLYQIEFWNSFLLKDSIYWFIGSGFLILFNLNKANKEKHFFRKILRDNLKLILILEFLVNFHHFGLLVELIILPIITFLAMLQAVAEREERTIKVKSLIDWFFAIFGLIVLGISIRDVLVVFRDFANIPNLKSFLLPIILSITFIPFAYCIALYMNFQILFIRLSLFVRDENDLRYAKWRTLLKSRMSLKKLNLISFKINKLHKGSKREEIKNSIT